VPGDRRTIDLNADIGEASDEAGIEVEQALLGLVTTGHIACGGHAGDAASMRRTIATASASGVRVGAHPSYPDRDGFGRRPMVIGVEDLTTSLSEQIGALVALATSQGATVRSVKPHGALYGEVGRGGTSCEALRAAMRQHCAADTTLVLPAGSPAVARMRQDGMPVLEEGFSDRAYASDGALVPRHEAGSVYDDPARAATQAVGLVVRDSVVADDGSVLALAVDTLCVHGDSPNAVALAEAVRHALVEAGVSVVALASPHRG
jgi:5-oxoprolinase (ATP-hydrolysing) subunit A